MDKRALLDRHAADSEERLTLSRVLDKAEAAQRHQSPESTVFLSPRERIAAEQLLRAASTGAYSSLGGYDGAERQLLVFRPDWMEPEFLAASDYITLLRCRWFHEESTPSHRDLLGAMMGMGIRRDTVGDILVASDSADLLVLPSIAPFLRDNLRSAGRVRLHLEELPLSDIHIPKQERKVLHDTVAALRLDSVLACGFSISRSKASQLIASGRVCVNWQDTGKSDFPVKAGDVLSCRGLGKCRLTEVGGLSRKGRINITMERYL